MERLRRETGVLVPPRQGNSGYGKLTAVKNWPSSTKPRAGARVGHAVRVKAGRSPFGRLHAQTFIGALMHGRFLYLWPNWSRNFAKALDNLSGHKNSGVAWDQCLLPFPSCFALPISFALKWFFRSWRRWSEKRRRRHIKSFGRGLAKFVTNYF